MKKATAFVHMKVSSNTFIPAFREACKICDVDLEVHLFGNNSLNNRYGILYRTSKNIATWGVKRKHLHYNTEKKNVLFFEFCAFCQKSGWWVDSEGLYADSRFNKQKLWNKLWSKGWEYKELEAYVKKWYPFELLSGGKKDGPIMVALQHEDDAPLRFYFAHGETEDLVLKKALEICREHLPDVDVIVRPHPKYLKQWGRKEKEYLKVFKPNWVLQKDMNIYEELMKCSAVVSVNSTVAIEALALGIPSATIGEGVFSGSGATLECAKDLSKLKNVLEWKPDLPNVCGFLHALIRHKIPVSPTVSDFLKNADFVLWIEKIRKG